ncbi:hypothetical protein Anas_11792 [Armadillidium nasatum]|uniref:Uncharacterized protein n=1 Tax=Armadillidium nasatum TaxID=96803 RepID=A0A5N5T3T2_9CRUS|nr:hypothetical protein Anas_11792 [Armadillidium nasatum]
MDGKDNQEHLYLSQMDGKDNQEHLYLSQMDGKGNQEHLYLSQMDGKDNQEHLYLSQMDGKDNQEHLYLSQMDGKDNQEHLYLSQMDGKENRNRPDDTSFKQDYEDKGENRKDQNTFLNQKTTIVGTFCFFPQNLSTQLLPVTDLIDSKKEQTNVEASFSLPKTCRRNFQSLIQHFQKWIKFILKAKM